jgi:hypothetical protein
MRTEGFFRTVGVSFALCLAFVAPLVAADAAPKPDNKWLIQFDHWAEADGELILKIAPVTGDAIEVTTRIPKGTTENSAADLVAGSLKGALGGGYSVKVNDGEKVIIKSKGKTGKFVVTVSSSSATGLELKIRH